MVMSSARTEAEPSAASAAPIRSDIESHVLRICASPSDSVSLPRTSRPPRALLRQPRGKALIERVVVLEPERRARGERDLEILDCRYQVWIERLVDQRVRVAIGNTLQPFVGEGGLPVGAARKIQELHGGGEMRRPLDDRPIVDVQDGIVPCQFEIRVLPAV